MYTKKGFVFVESVLLFMMVCLIVLVLGTCLQGYQRVKKMEVDTTLEESSIRDIYEE